MKISFLPFIEEYTVYVFIQEIYICQVVFNTID